MSQHVHKYKRTRLGDDYTIYKCMIPNCPHYVPPELVIGRMTRCWRCGSEVVMTQPMAKQAKPHCIGCTKTYRKRRSDDGYTSSGVA